MESAAKLFYSIFKGLHGSSPFQSVSSKCLPQPLTLSKPALTNVRGEILEAVTRIKAMIRTLDRVDDEGIRERFHIQMAKHLIWMEEKLNQDRDNFFAVRNLYQLAFDFYEEVMAGSTVTTAMQEYGGENYSYTAKFVLEETYLKPQAGKYCGEVFLDLELPQPGLSLPRPTQT